MEDHHKNKPNKKKSHKKDKKEKKKDKGKDKSKGSNRDSTSSINNNAHKALLKPPRYESTNDKTNNLNITHLDNKHELDIIIKARAFSYNPKTNTYILKLENAKLLSQNLSQSPPSIIFEIAPSKIHKTSQTALLHEDDIDAILDEIERNERRHINMSQQTIHHYQTNNYPQQQFNSYYHHNHNMQYPPQTGNGHSPYNNNYYYQSSASHSYHDNNAHHEYSQSYSAQRHHIKVHHSREESKQQIPTIHDNEDHHSSHHNNSHRTDHKNEPKMGHAAGVHTIDSLRSIPPIPSIHGDARSQSHNHLAPSPSDAGGGGSRKGRSYNKYRDSVQDRKRKPDDIKNKQKIDKK